MAEIDPLAFQKGYQASQAIFDNSRKNKLQDLLLDEKVREMNDTQNANRLYAAAVGPDGTIDRTKLVTSYAQGGLGSKIPGLQTQFAAQDKSQREADKARLESVMQNVQLQGQLLGGVKDESSYQNALNAARQNGIDVSKLPPSYDPNTISQLRSRALSAAQQVEQEWKQKKYDQDVAQFDQQQQQRQTQLEETQRHNRATEETQRATVAATTAKAGEKQQEKDQAKQATIANAEDALSVVDKAINHPGRETASGVSGSIDPRNYLPGTDARNFKAVLDQIKGQAFMQAYQGLRGGGQITEVEGKKATDAIARLDTAQSDKEFLTALNDLRGVMAAGYKRLSGKDYGATPTDAQTTRTAPTNAPKDGSVSKSKSGKPIVFRNGQWEYQ